MEIQVTDFIVWQLCSFVIIVAVIIAVSLIFKRNGSSVANQLLGLIVLLSALTISNNLVSFTGIRNQFPWTLFIPLDFSLYIGPLLLLYFKVKIRSRMQFKLLQFVHFIIPILFTLFYLYWFLKPLKDRVTIYNHKSFDLFFLLENIFLISSLLLYVYLSNSILKSAMREKEWQHFLNKWLKFFLKVILILIFSEIFFLILSLASDFLNINSSLFDYFQLLVDVSLLLWLAYKAYEQYYPKNIFGKKPGFIPNFEIIKVDNLDMGKTSDLERLKNSIEIEKIHQNQDLDLELLSNHLNMSKQKLSNLIKVNFHKSFTLYINDYRLEDVISKLNSDAHKEYTILGIAFDAGFSSRTTFYRHFNNRIGMSPKEYIENPFKITLI